MPWFPTINHAVSVIIQHAFFQGVQGTVQLQPSMRGREGRDKHIGLKAALTFFLCHRRDELHHVFTAYAYSGNLIDSIVENVEQLMGRGDDMSLWLVLMLAKFSP